jgi:hypothetical protein
MGDGIAANVLVGVVGGVFRGPLTATLPNTVALTVEAALLSAGYAKSGYISTDGVTQAIGTSTSKILAWGGDNVRTVQTEHDVTFAFTALEHNADTLKMYYGETATGTYVEINGEQLPVSKFVIPVRDGTKRISIVIPAGQVTERGDVQYYGEDAAGLPITITAYPDANGVKAYLYIGDLVVNAPTITTLDQTSGPIAGENTVEINGTGFVNVRNVYFGTIPALAFNATSTTKLYTIAPAQAAGVKDVTVRTEMGTSVVTATTKYTYV